MCAFYEEKSALSCSASLDRLCGRSNGGGRSVELANTLYGAIDKNGQTEVCSCGGWISSGSIFLLFLDRVIPHLHMNATEPEGAKSSFQRTTMLVLAVTLHNIPEGMAVGVVYAGWAADHHAISAAGALALSLGIAIQNFPEGAIISMPLRSEGMGKEKPLSTAFYRELSSLLGLC